MVPLWWRSTNYRRFFSLASIMTCSLPTVLLIEGSYNSLNFDFLLLVCKVQLQNTTPLLSKGERWMLFENLYPHRINGVRVSDFLISSFIQCWTTDSHCSMFSTLRKSALNCALPAPCLGRERPFDWQTHWYLIRSILHWSGRKSYGRRPSNTQRQACDTWNDQCTRKHGFQY